MKYIVKRAPVRYEDGTYAPEAFLKGIQLELGRYYELTNRADEAFRFSRKSGAVEVAKALGWRFYVTKID